MHQIKSYSPNSVNFWTGCLGVCVHSCVSVEGHCTELMDSPETTLFFHSPVCFPTDSESLSTSEFQAPAEMRAHSKTSSFLHISGCYHWATW